MIELTDWKNLAITEATRQNVQSNIVLATVEAETNGSNIVGDSGNALGYGQVWPQWHIDAFDYAAEVLGMGTIPHDLESLTTITLGNDEFSMIVAVYVIKNCWLGNKGNFREFSLDYVGPAIPDSDYERRRKIWEKYSGDTSYVLSGETPSDTQTMDANGLQFYEDYKPPLTNYAIKEKFASGNVLYGRKYRLLVANNKGNALDVSDLRCTFNASKTVLMQPNYSDISIYNLSAETEATLIKEGYRVVLEAGYEGSNYGIIFDGDVIQPIREKEDGTTYKLTLRALDGDRFMNYGFVNFSFLRGLSSRAQVAQLAAKAKNPSDLGSISEELEKTKLPRGKVMFGLARDYMKQIAQTHKASFYVENGKVNIIKADEVKAGQIIDLSPQSGLIGTPEQTEFSIKVKALLNPQIHCNMLVHIDNSYIRARKAEMGQMYRQLDNDGIYRVISCNYTGDTRGDDWYVEFEAISQAGLLPGLIPGGTANPW